LLYDGASVKHAAAKLGITEGSARQYLRRIFAKTGTNRQIDLIREIARTAAGGAKDGS
jgi:DNA-binding CsgD family transcriptional regulator